MSTIRWTESNSHRRARRHSESAVPPPVRVVVADDRMRADLAYRLACEGTAVLWQGDFHNARHLLRAMDRRLARPPRPQAGDPAEAFRLHRRTRGHRARVLGRLLVLLEDDHRLDLRRAPDVRRACAQAYGPPSEPMAVSLTELLGVLGAHQWRRNGVWVPALAARIHPHYGVFSPVRGEYVDLVAQAPLPASTVRRTAFDIGTGTGVLAAVLARRGFGRIVATDIGPRALACAHDNIRRLGLADRVDVLGPALFPAGRADLVVCNRPGFPPVPPRPSSRVSTTREALCSGDFWTGSPLTSHRAVKDGSSCRTWPSVWNSGRTVSWRPPSSRRACTSWTESTPGPDTHGCGMSPTPSISLAPRRSHHCGVRPVGERSSGRAPTAGCPRGRRLICRGFTEAGKSTLE